MSINTYAIALEHYVKMKPDFKALESAKANGTYDKAIMRFVLEFTRLSAPKRVWDVSRAELIEDMGIVIERHATANRISLSGPAFAFRSVSGYLRILFASSVDEYDYKLQDIPNAYRNDFQPSGGYISLSTVGPDVAYDEDGNAFEYDYRIIDTIVNVHSRLFHEEGQL